MIAEFMHKDLSSNSGTLAVFVYFLTNPQFSHLLSDNVNSFKNIQVNDV